MGYSADTELESPQKWTKSFTSGEMLGIFKLANTINPNQQKASTTLSLNCTLIDELVGILDNEVGTSKSLQYNLVVKPVVILVANIILDEEDVHTIYEPPFTPSLTIEFGKGSPSYISIESLDHTSPGIIEGTNTIFHESVMNQRMASFVATAVTVPLLAITTWFYLRTKPAPYQKPIKKIIAPHKEIIAETTQNPPETTTTINLKTLEDLAKVSEALIKPILHTTGPTSKGQTTHTFYIIENNTKYQYTTTAPTEN